MKIEIQPLIRVESADKDSLVLSGVDEGNFVQVAKVNFVVDGVVVETKYLSVALHDRHNKIHLGR